MDNVGVIHGRFQFLHKGHMEYLLAGKERCKHLYIGICNPDVRLTTFSSANPHRSSHDANPLSYFERFQMICGAMVEAGVCRDEFDVIPFPINYPELIFNYAPKEAKYYVTIYDGWGVEKKKTLEHIGCDVDVMWTRTNADRLTSGTEVRSLVMQGKEWKHLVPDYVYNYVITHEIDKRLQERQ